MEGQHLILYDGTCGLCHRLIGFLLAQDKDKIFLFAPLEGETAKFALKDWRIKFPDADTVVLIENFNGDHQKQVMAFGKGAFRILWLLGGIWKIPGGVCFLPGVVYDWAYRWVAGRRFRWFSRQSCPIPADCDISRFLP